MSLPQKKIYKAPAAAKPIPRTKWKITISRDALFGNWSFAYTGKLTWWQICCITLAGWKIERIKS